MTAITLSNINKRFGEKVLFRDYSLHIEAGEFVAIKGESGAGKTTLLNIIGLLETPDSGSVTLCGARNPSFSSRAAVHLRRHKLSYLFQNYGLVDTDTVEANMKLATRFGKAKGKAEKERIADALAQVGLSGYERRKVYTLSGGEQQRVALAKIIAKSPDIILADEPTGSLDERNRSYVMDILKELNRQGKPLSQSRILLLGMSYKADIRDIRESPSLRIWELLEKSGARLSYYDPYVPSVTFASGKAESLPACTPEVLGQFDAALLCTGHSCLDGETICRCCPLVFDTRNAFAAVKSGHKVVL